MNILETKRVFKAQRRRYNSYQGSIEKIANLKRF